LLSHDRKILTSKITDKSDGGGNRTKEVRIIGYPVVVFCTASQRFDEQEATRFMMLSPEITVEKIRLGVAQKILKETDGPAYFECLKTNDARQALIQRVLRIKSSGIGHVRIEDREEMEKQFWKSVRGPKPRHQRDVSKVMGLCMAHALLNYVNRRREGDTLYATTRDIDAAISVFAEIAECQEYGLSPYVYNIYRNVIWPLLGGSHDTGVLKAGATRQQILDMYYKVCGLVLSEHKLRQEILPALQQAGLIDQMTDPDGSRRTIVVLANGGS
jgi:hypothetical protein